MELPRILKRKVITNSAGVNIEVEELGKKLILLRENSWFNNLFVGTMNFEEWENAKELFVSNNEIRITFSLLSSGQINQN